MKDKHEQKCGLDRAWEWDGQDTKKKENIPGVLATFPT